ncbi:hypothetical protein BDK51DRAFT_31709, partial [Blyttiomyces helicus]
MDSMESPEILPKMLDLLHVIASKYPEAFGSSFRDVIDLLVGWNIEPTLSRSISSLISDSFKKFWRYWSKNLDFGLELLRHLIVDMESVGEIAADSGSGTVDGVATKSTRRRLPAKLMTLMRLVIEVDARGWNVPGNEDCFVSIQAIPSSFAEFLDLVHCALRLIYLVDLKFEDRMWHGQGIEIIKFLGRALGDGFAPFQKRALDIIVLKLAWDIDDYEGTGRSSGEAGDSLAALAKDVSSWLDVLHEILDTWAPDFESDVRNYLLRPSSSPFIMKIRLYCCGKSSVMEKLLRTFRLVLPSRTADPSSDLAPRAEELLLEMREVFDELRNRQLDEDADSESSVLDYDSDRPVAAPAAEPSSFSAIALVESEWDAVLDAERERMETIWRSLGAISTESLLPLLEFDLGLTAEAAALDAPGFPIQGTYWIMETMLGRQLRASSASFFIPYLFASESQSLETLAATQTLIHSEVQLIHTVLTSKDVFPDRTLAVCKWLESVVHCERDSRIRIQISLQDTDRDVRRAFSKLVVSFRPLVSIEPLDSHKELSLDGFPIEFKLSSMSIPHLGTFRPKHFSAVVTLLGMGGHLITRDEAALAADVGLKEAAWLERLFHTCQGASLLTKSSKLVKSSKAFDLLELNEIDVSEDLLMFWALWETARYCVLTRLRTPLGAPIQTFEAIERTLNDLVRACESMGEEGVSDEDSAFLLARLRHLLDFIDILELQVYNAAEGSLRCPPAPKASIMFYYANRRSCEEWFGRIRKTVVRGARIVGYSGILIRHSMQ